MFRLPLFVLFIALSTSLAAADDDATKKDQAAEPAATKIGVVDVTYLLKQHPGLKKKREDMKVEAALVQAEFESDAKAVQKKSIELKEMTQGSDEYKALDSEIVKRQAAIQAEYQIKRKEFTQREARMICDVYQQIKKDVATLAKRRHLTIVINADLQETSIDKSDDVVRELNKQVLWLDDSINLTPLLEKHYASKSQ